MTTTQTTEYLPEYHHVTKAKEQNLKQEEQSKNPDLENYTNNKFEDPNGDKGDHQQKEVHNRLGKTQRGYPKQEVRRAW